MAAYTLGANIIERHYTLDRTWKGTDHAASLEPSGLRKLKRDLEAVYDALSYKSEDILPIEKVQRDKLKNTERELKFMPKKVFVFSLTVLVLEFCTHKFL